MLSENIFFSVIIPAHQRPHLLQEALESLHQQTFKNFEVIVSDDSCMDEIKEMTEKYEPFFRVRYLKNQNQKGALKSRNYAGKYVQGLYIAFLDDDDFWAPTYLQHLYNIIKEKESEIIISKYFIYTNSDKKIIGEKCLPLNFKFRDFATQNPGVLCSNVCLKLESFQKLNGFNEKLFGSADKDLFLRSLEKGFSYFINTQALVYWRYHDSQWSSVHLQTLKSKLKFYFYYFKNYQPSDHLKMMTYLVWLSTELIKNKRGKN
jgi:glycosyltransferase involved in cell wall biosynthesis